MDDTARAVAEGLFEAIRAEQDGYHFYRELVQWERGHHDALLRQQEMLKEAYWSASGFARW
jgi:hypothetical protein